MPPFLDLNGLAKQGKAFFDYIGARNLDEGKVMDAKTILDRLLNSINIGTQQQTIFGYRFGPEIPGDDAGAFHSSDLWFEFETLAKCWRPFKGKHYDLARQMCNDWTNFANSGEPNGLDADGTPMPKWTPYTLKSPLVMEFLDKPGMEKEQSKLKNLLLEDNKKFLYKVLIHYPRDKGINT
jgi:carboxylesterase type B